MTRWNESYLSKYSFEKSTSKIKKTIEQPRGQTIPFTTTG